MLGHEPTPTVHVVLDYCVINRITAILGYPILGYSGRKNILKRDCLK